MAEAEEAAESIHDVQSLCSSGTQYFLGLERHWLTIYRQLFRLCNIVLTTAALAIAIRIRIIEARSGVTGALGSSPYVSLPDHFHGSHRS